MVTIFTIGASALMAYLLTRTILRRRERPYQPSLLEQDAQYRAVYDYGFLDESGIDPASAPPSNT